MPGIEHCITSDGFFALQQQPESVAVVGGGYIGVELAGVFQALGTRTSLLTRADKPLKGFDDLLVIAACPKGVTVMCGGCVWLRVVWCGVVVMV